MLFGVYVHTYGPFSDPNLLAELAGEAKSNGWDGFFVWDHLRWKDAIADAQISLGLIANKVSGDGFKFGPMVTPLARRRPWKVARELLTLDRMAPGQVVFGTGIGVKQDFYFSEFEQARFDDSANELETNAHILQRLLGRKPDWQPRSPGIYDIRDSQGFEPKPSEEIPFWGSYGYNRDAANQTKNPIIRAARSFDGLFPIIRKVIKGKTVFDPTGCLTPSELQWIVDTLPSGKIASRPFEVVASGCTWGNGDPVDLRGLQAAGLTFWLETFAADATEAHVRQVITSGPPRP